MASARSNRLVLGGVRPFVKIGLLLKLLLSAELRSLQQIAGAVMSNWAIRSVLRSQVLMVVPTAVVILSSRHVAGVVRRRYQHHLVLFSARIRRLKRGLLLIKETTARGVDQRLTEVVVSRSREEVFFPRGTKDVLNLYYVCRDDSCRFTSL